MKAQETDVILTQHWFFPSLLSPAAAGDSDFIRIRGGGRIDNLGIHGEPRHYLAGADSPFVISGHRIGGGVIANISSFGLFRNILVDVQGSYTFRIKKGELKLGIQAGYFHTLYRGEKNSGGLQQDQSESEPSLPLRNLEGGALDLGIGIRYDLKNFHIGLSALHITNPKLKLSEDDISSGDITYVESKLPATFYLETGGNIGLKNPLFKLQPTLLIGTDFNQFHTVAEMTVNFKDLLTFGVDYRYKKAIGVFTGVAIKNFYAGYSWEYDFSHYAKGSAGNHEIVLGYNLRIIPEKKPLYRQRSIRLM